MTNNFSTRRAISVLGVYLGILQLSCSGSGSSARAANGIVERDTTIRHEDCDVRSGSAAKLDANGDGKPNVTIVREGGREVCRAVDLNFDGVVDTWTYYDGNGKVRRRETDYDRDGRIDEISIYKDALLAEKRRATLLANRLDTWEFYQAGRLARSERDSNGDRLIDQWWEYPRQGCPVIHADVNSDGRPDPGASVDYCKETGYVPPERQDFRQTESPNFEQSTSLPTETSSREEGAPPPAAAGAPSTGARGTGTGTGGATGTSTGGNP
ncbi:MAG TPA: hypothetical protein VER33_17240 [Polyangiaceae bacterium]|nr:hypothetical protein [Polyangiaceae bacterium]